MQVVWMSAFSKVAKGMHRKAGRAEGTHIHEDDLNVIFSSMLPVCAVAQVAAHGCMHGGAMLRHHMVQIFHQISPAISIIILWPQLPVSRTRRQAAWKGTASTHFHSIGKDNADLTQRMASPICSACVRSKGKLVGCTVLTLKSQCRLTSSVFHVISIFGS